MSTEAELGYQDAIHQVLKSMQRRHKALQEQRKEAVGVEQVELKTKMNEIEHMMKIVESLHR